MLDNLQLIPAEAFTASGSFAEKLLDKVSEAIGWSVIPKNTKKYRKEAEEYLIEQIIKDEKIPVLAKAAYISNAKKIIKYYVNKCDIFIEAMNYLTTEESFAKAENVDDDWLEYFFNKAQTIGREDLKSIWAMLLAEKIKNPQRVSKQLLHILSVISYEEAVSFGKLADYTIRLDDDVAVLFYDEELFEFYKENGLIQEEILRLQDIGLLQYDCNGYTFEREKMEKVMYFDNEIPVGTLRFLNIGNVILSRAGRELMMILNNGNSKVGFEEIINKYIKNT